MPVPALLLAAGASRRLGTPKQALRWKGEALLHHAARVALEAGCAPVIVVLGAEAELAREVVADLPVSTVHNPGWEEGMGASLRTGMTALPPEAEAVLLLVCDQPALEANLLAAFLAAHREAPGRVIAAAYAGIRGVPALFPRAFFPALRALAGDRGARGLLGGEAVVELDFPGGELDVDRPEDCGFMEK